MELSLNSDEAIIKLMLILAHADENYHENEEKIIKDIVKKNNIELSSYQKILKEVKSSKKSYKEECLKALQLIKDENLRQKTLKSLTNLAAADFILHEDEMLLLQLISDEWGMYQERLEIKDAELQQ
jgi:uncharacterized tellurite resistance protein B-like protein|tara:strand:- start:192 stop:572 length:381 start_codon:yes stop_codon:yes gene_type:complete